MSTTEMLEVGCGFFLPFRTDQDLKNDDFTCCVSCLKVLCADYCVVADRNQLSPSHLSLPYMATKNISDREEADIIKENIKVT